MDYFDVLYIQNTPFRNTKAYMIGMNIIEKSRPPVYLVKLSHRSTAETNYCICLRRECAPRIIDRDTSWVTSLAIKKSKNILFCFLDEPLFIYVLIFVDCSVVQNNYGRRRKKQFTNIFVGAWVRPRGVAYQGLKENYF